MGREGFASFLALDWTAVTVAIIAAVGSIIAACANIVVIRLLWTPSRTRIGRQVEDTQQIALANNYAWQRVLSHLGIDGEKET